MNPDMLVLARQFAELTQGELAERTGTTQGRISKIENGLAEPDEALLQQFQRVLGFSRDFFEQTDPVYGLPLTYHRKRQSVSAKALARVHAEINIRRLNLARLLRAAEIEHGEIPQLDPDEYGSPEAVARALRAAWRLPRGPVRNLVATLESNGCVIFSCQFAADVDAIGQRAPGLPAAVYLNDRMTADRQRFTLAHELGHLVMHTIPSPEMEVEADRFAGEFLMPADDIKNDLTALTLPKLAALKSVWRVSMAALLRRARDLGRVSDSKYRSLWIQMSKMGLKTQEPPETQFPKENPTLVAEIIEFHVSELQYSYTELASALHLGEKNFTALWGPRRGWLRLVAS